MDADVRNAPEAKKPKRTWREGRPIVASAITLAALVPAVGFAVATHPRPNPAPMAVVFGGALWIGFEVWKALGGGSAGNGLAKRFVQAGASVGAAFVAFNALFFAMMGLWMGPFGMRF